MSILKEIFKRPVTIIFSIILIIVLGVLSTTQLAINLLPDITFPYLSVKTIYVGADAEAIDKNVTKPIEDSLSSISDIHNLSTYSIDNASIIILEFDYGVNLEKKEKEIDDKLEAVKLPSDCEKPAIYTIDLNGTSVTSISLYGADDITEQALLLEKKLLSISGVSTISVIGAPKESISIMPINGLEMISGFLVTELVKDNALDIPLGELKDEFGKISINNESSAKTIDEIKNMMVSVELDSSYIELFKSVQEIIKNIEDLNVEELENMKKDADDMLSFINELENKSIADLDSFVSNINSIKALVEVIEGNTSGGLKLMWSQVLARLFEDETFKSLNDDELHKMADNYGVSYELLKWLQDNSDVNPSTGKTYAEEKWEIIVKFRENNPDKIEDILYANLFYDIELIPNDINDSNYKSEEEIADAVKLTRVINTVALDRIVEKLKNSEKIENNDYALLFSTPSYNYAIPITATTIKMIRDSHFEDNYKVFHNYKINHVHEELDESNNPIMKGDNISSSDFMALYNQMKFDSEFELKPTEKLLEFVRNVDFTSSTIKFRISQAADVVFESVYETRAFYNGVPAIQIEVYGNSNCNTTSIANDCKKIIEEFNLNSNDVKAVMLNNQADFINESLSNALVSLIIGMVLAVAVIYLFLFKVKSSLIIAISMPISVLLTLICLYLMGITLNMVSVGGIAVGIGMLVDNSIVVLDSISNERSKGKDVFHASIDGVKLVLGSLIGSTLTSVCVFFPILLINGLTKEIFADLAWAVIFSLSWSLIVAVIVIPTLFCLFYKKEKIENIKVDGKIFTKIKKFYEKILTKALKLKGITILAAMVVFLASIGLIFTCPIEFLPSIDQGKIEITVNFSTSDDPQDCQERTMKAYNLICDNIDEIESSAMCVGFGGLVYTSQNGTILLELNNQKKKTKDIVEEIRTLLINNEYNERYQIEELDGVVASLVGGMAGVSVTILGDDVDVLKEIAGKVEAKVIEMPGIKNASDNMLEASNTYRLEFDKDKLAYYNIDYQNLIQTLRIGFAGYTVSSIIESEYEFNVNVKFNNQTIDYYDSFEKIIVGFDDDSNPVYLKDVCNIIESNGRHVIRKSDGKNELTITIEPYGIDTNTATKYLKNSCKEVLKDYEGYTFYSGGVSAYLSDAFSGLFVALIISFVLLFGIMACLFESLRKPCIIIFSFPFAFTGGFIALAISRVSLNVVSFIGLIMLMGVIINDAIVLNERIDQLREGGLNDNEAVVEGCKERLRAVLMTTMTTVLALIPMALGLGKGGALMQPLGVIAIGGMTIGTLVTLVLIPSVYSLVYKINFKNKKIEKNEE